MAESVKNFYNQFADLYEQFEGAALKGKDRFPLLHAIRSAEWELLTRARGSKVFYFATGSGRDVLRLVQLGNTVVTCDFSREMLRKTTKRLQAAGVAYDYTNGIGFSDFDLDNIPSHRALIVEADIDDFALLPDQFDWCFSYCTIPHMLENADNVLDKLIRSCRNGAVSVYLSENLPQLCAYYRNFGLDAQVEGSYIHISGGFSYYCVPPDEVSSIIQAHRKLEVMDVGLGKIYIWSEH